MAFDVQMIFTGVCAYAPDKDWEDPDNVPKRLNVVLPDGRNATTVNLELGTKPLEQVRRHEPFLCIPRFCPAERAQGFEIVDLSGHRYEIELDDVAARGNPLTVVRTGETLDVATQPTNANGHDIRWIPNLTGLLATGLSRLHGTGLLNQSPHRVVSRITLAHGMVRTHYSNQMDWIEAPWHFPNSRGVLLAPRFFANQVEVLLRGVSSFKLLSRSLFGAENLQEVSLPPTESGTLSLVFANLCSEQSSTDPVTNPMGYLTGKEAAPNWLQFENHGCKARTDGVESVPMQDLDFPLVYTVLDDLSALKMLYTHGIPTLRRPEPSEGGGSARTAQCYGATVLQ